MKRSSTLIALLSLLAACGASPTPVATPATVTHDPADRATRSSVSAAQPSSDPRCGGRHTLCSLTGCGDGKTLCLYVATDVKAIVKDVIADNRAAFSRCYEGYLGIDPTAEGTVRTVFRIDAHGAVPEASAVGIHSSVEACVVAALERLTFPELTGHPTLVRYPFVFHRQP